MVVFSPSVGFNPRPRAGGDAEPSERRGWAGRVSIHAPARGATGARATVGGGRVEFQSTPPRGGRRCWRGKVRGMGGFQSTPPRGGRQGELRDKLIFESRFNPRPRAGGDEINAKRYNRLIMFQSTPPRGGRPSRWIISSGVPSVSIHAPARGATDGEPSVLPASPVSIHAPARGATAVCLRLQRL